MSDVIAAYDVLAAVRRRREGLEWMVLESLRTVPAVDLPEPLQGPVRDWLAAIAAEDAASVRLSEVTR